MHATSQGPCYALRHPALQMSLQDCLAFSLNRPLWHFPERRLDTRKSSSRTEANEPLPQGGVVRVFAIGWLPRTQPRNVMDCNVCLSLCPSRGFLQDGQLKQIPRAQGSASPIKQTSVHRTLLSPFRSFVTSLEDRVCPNNSQLGGTVPDQAWQRTPWS